MISTCKYCSQQISWQKNGTDPTTGKIKWQPVVPGTNQVHKHTKEEIQQYQEGQQAQQQQQQNDNAEAIALLRQAIKLLGADNR
jgi:hypothetical protein